MRARLAEEATAREWMVNIGMRSGLERMAHLLCELLERLVHRRGRIMQNHFAKTLSLQHNYQPDLYVLNASLL